MHSRMIRAIRRWQPRRRGWWLGGAATVLLGLLLSARPASPAAGDPAAEARRQAVLRDVATSADSAWAALEARLQAARDPARQGAALVVDGSEAPEPALEAAADLLDAALSAADEAAIAERRLAGTLRSVRPDLVGLTPDPLPTAEQLAGIAGQLRSAAEAAGDFVQRRHAADETLARMRAALAAFARDDVSAALGQLDAASEARAVLLEWERPPPTLDLWLSTTGELIAAARAIADAALAGDPQAAEAAAESYAAAAENARRADVSLALSISETGAGLTATPLRRLADALAAIAAARAAVAPLQQGGS